MNLTKDDLHHAYIIEGSSESVYPKICEFCEGELSFPTKANPDFVYEEIDKFLISHARRLREMQMNKTGEGSRKIFIIYFNFITREAQNALLKVLEEPTDGTHFFIITPSAHVFLDTVLSRVTVISDYKSIVEGTDALKFLKSNVKDRFSMITKLVKNIKDEKASKSDAIRLVQEIKRNLYEECKSKKDFNKIKVLGELEEIEDYLHDNSASVKMLLEKTALVV